MMIIQLILLSIISSTVSQHDLPVFPPPTQLFCPTLGTTAYVLVTVTPMIDESGFASLLQFYTKLMPDNSTQQIKYEFHFGSNSSLIIKTYDLENDINDLIHDEQHLSELYASALTVSSDQEQYQTTGLTDIARSILDSVSRDNQQDVSIYQKKQVVLLTDYVPWNITNIFNLNQNENTQILGIFHEIDISTFDKAAQFPVFSMEDSHIKDIRTTFQLNMNFEFPQIVYAGKPQSDIYVFMTTANLKQLQQVITMGINGPTCQLPTNKMYSEFVHAQIILNGTVWEMVIPWLGAHTATFSNHCLNTFNHSAASKNCTMKYQIFTNFVDHVTQASNQTFAYLFIDDVECADVLDLKFTMHDTTHIRVVMDQNLNTVYENFTLPLTHSGLLDKSVDNQVIENNAFYLLNYSTSCTDEIPIVPLIASRPWHRPKYLSIAIDDMVTILICATISAVTFGVLIYRHVSRKHRQQVELLSEIMLQPRIYKAPKECPKVARLPWEIKSDNVHIDREFLLGEGTISNVYLGKLKGKAPIMQWIDRIEMKQYQDCAVAVRVPRHFDEPEEDQLQREIASMRQLRHHDHIALLLGWTNKNDLVCSLLELTHMNLIKYLAQIKENAETTSNTNGFTPMSRIPFQALYKIIFEVCDGIEYLHSRNLVHRDLTARNILLTTGLRAKISGFGFCSEPDDPKFSQNSLALRYLPVRWLAPECFTGKFSMKSDSWSFGVMMFEMFTLGEQPYEDLIRPEEIIESVRKARVPAHPRYASKQTYKIMLSCFQTFTSRRPTFTQLKAAFHTNSTNYYHNPAFQSDD